MKWFCRAIARWKNVEPSISIDQIAKIKTYLHGENSFSEETREAIVSELQTANDGWNPNRLLWRVFTPAVAGLVAFAVYLAGVSGAIFVKIENDSGAFAYSFCFILGYFSDAVVSKMANWVEGLIG